MTLPLRVLEYLSGETARSLAPACILVGKDGRVIETAGPLERYGLGGLSPGQDAEKRAPVLHGLLPLRGAVLILPKVQFAPGASADIHLVPATEGDWVILLDASQELSAWQRVQQIGNELSLQRGVTTPSGGLAADGVPAALLGALDIAAFERVGRGAYRIRGEVPPWLVALWPECRVDRPDLRPQQRFPFLEDFVREAERARSEGTPEPQASGPWTEESGEAEVVLEATALTLPEGWFLLLRRLGSDFEARRNLLQKARESVLTRESLEREVQRRTAHIREREEQIVLRLAAAAEFRDGDTGEHIRRLGLVSGVVAEALGWDGARIADLRLAATMHDVGKIGLSDDILLKPGPLTPDERAVMQRHTAIGASILEGVDVPLMRMARDIALCHHERWDGSGYPRQLREDAIPEAARIVAVVDVYDALSHRRIYRPAWPEADVLAYVEAGRGTHFENRIVDAFMGALPRIRRFRQRTPQHQQVTPEDA